MTACPQRRDTGEDMRLDAPEEERKKGLTQDTGLRNCAEELEEGRTKDHLIRKVSVSLTLENDVLHVRHIHRPTAQGKGKCGQMKTSYMTVAVKISRGSLPSSSTMMALIFIL